MARNTNPPIKGHKLIGEGRPHDDLGQYNGRYGMYVTTGVGRAKCECGEMSGILDSAGKRKAWHRHHKDLIRGEAR